MRMLHCADKITGHTFGPEMEDYTVGLKAKRSRFKDFEKNSGMVLKMNASTGNID